MFYGEAKSQHRTDAYSGCRHGGNDPYPAVWMIPFSVILLHGINDFGPISRWLNTHGCTLWTKLGKLSMYIYLLHLQVILICRHLMVTDHSITGSILILAAALAFSALVMTIRETYCRHRLQHV